MSFMVRRISYQSNIQTQEKGESVLIDPNKIVFQNPEQNRINISKIILRNTAKNDLTFTITQPKESIFRVRFNKTLIPAQGKIEIFVFLNPQNFVKTIIDQFIITFSKDYSIHIPITVNQPIRNPNRYLKSTNIMKSKDTFMRTSTSKKRLGYRGERRKNNLQFDQKKNNQEIEELVLRFLDKYKKIEGFLKEKTINNQIFLGEKIISQERYLSIIGFNLRMEFIADEEYKKKILSRHVQEFSKEGPNIQNFKQMKPRWDKSRNQRKITLRKAMAKLTEEVRKIVISYRFKKMYRVMQIYRQMNEELNILEVQSTIVPNRWENQHLQQQQDNLPSSTSSLDSHQEDEKMKKHQYLCRKIQKNIFKKSNKFKLGADFNEFTLVPRIIEQDFSTYNRKNIRFHIKPMIGLDNWISLQESTGYSHEFMDYYKTMPRFVWECFPSIPFEKESKESQKQGIRSTQNGVIPFDCPSANSSHDNYSVTQFMELSNQELYGYSTIEALTEDIDLPQAKKSEFGPELECLCKKQYASPIYQIKVEKQFIQNIQHFREKEILGTLAWAPRTLIYSVRREDRTDFDRLSKLEQVKRDRIRKRENRKAVEKNNVQEMQEMQELEQREEKNGKTEEFSVFYEHLLGNLEKVKIRRISVGLNKIIWINRPIKKRQNMIYF